MDVLPKITLKDLGCNGAAAGALNKEGERIALARIYGVASGLKVKEDKRNSSFHTALQGSFRGKNLQEGTDNFGKVFSSGLLYLPDGLQQLVEAELTAAGDNAEVTFALDVFSYKVNRAGAPYSYGGVILGEPSKEDPLARIEAMIGDKPPLGIEHKDAVVETETKKDKKGEHAPA